MSNKFVKKFKFFIIFLFFVCVCLVFVFEVFKCVSVSLMCFCCEIWLWILSVLLNCFSILYLFFFKDMVFYIFFKFCFYVVFVELFFLFSWLLNVIKRVEIGCVSCLVICCEVIWSGVWLYMILVLRDWSVVCSWWICCGCFV